ncbi:hypothetical protein [Variovorax paradoxus]
MRIPAAPLAIAAAIAASVAFVTLAAPPGGQRRDCQCQYLLFHTENS